MKVNNWFNVITKTAGKCVIGIASLYTFGVAFKGEHTMVFMIVSAWIFYWIMSDALIIAFNLFKGEKEDDDVVLPIRFKGEGK